MTMLDKEGLAAAIGWLEKLGTKQVLFTDEEKDALAEFIARYLTHAASNVAGLERLSVVVGTSTGQPYAFMKPDPDGDYVQFANVLTLSARAEAMKAALGYLRKEMCAEQELGVSGFEDWIYVIDKAAPDAARSLSIKEAGNV